MAQFRPNFVYNYRPLKYSFKGPTMAKKPLTRTAKKKEPDAVETSMTIEEQTRAFLASGGSVEQVNIGVSGQVGIAGPKHITLGNNRSQSK